LRLSFEQQLGDLEAVVRALSLAKIVPVAHDSSGMAALNYALTRPDEVDSVIMLNCAYSEDSTVLSVAVAKRRQSQLKNASLTVIAAGHWLQADEPEQVAEAMLK
jgi:pimeloyl-ACP methyl ester carboxylesterase